MTPVNKALAGSIVLIGSILAAATASATAPDTSATETVFANMDTNKDGKISNDEHAAGAKQMFEKMDANKDGKVTATEMDAAHKRVTGKPATTSDMPAADKIKVIDIDGDNILSIDEHFRGARVMFDRMDTNRDSFLSRTELSNGHASLQKKPADGILQGATLPNKSVGAAMLSARPFN